MNLLFFPFFLSLFISHIQDDTISGRVITQLEQYITALPQDKIYIHLDKPYYSAGEDIWFKAYLVSGPYHYFVQSKTILYVELIDMYGRVIEQRMVKMENGLGHGDFSLQHSALPGDYVIRAYTRFMQNYDPYFLFRKRIRVLPRSMKEHKTNETDSVLVSHVPLGESTENELMVRFFPEGGDLVNNIVNYVAFKATGQNGKGIRISGQIERTADEWLMDIESNELGMGVFRIIPSEKVTLTAKFNFRGKDYDFQLPESTKQGYVMHVNFDDDKINITVQNNMKLIMDNSFLVGQIRGVPFTVIHTNPGKKFLYASLNSDKIPNGVSQFTFFDAQGVPHCERLVYIDNTDNELELSVSSDKNAFKQREKANFTLSLKDPFFTPVSSDLSVGITHTGLVNQEDIQSDIRTYLLLESDLKGTIENPMYYFDPKNSSRYKDLDILMLTHGWRRFVWSEILNDKPPSANYPFENGFTIEGQLYKYYNQKKLIPGYVSLFLYEDQFVYDEVKSNEDGYFMFRNLDISDSSVVFLQAKKDPEKIKLNFLRSKDKVKDDIAIKVKKTDPAAINPTCWPQGFDGLEEEIVINYLEKNEYRLQIDSAFEGKTIILDEVLIKDTRISKKNPLEISTKYYFDPDYQVVIDSMPDFYQDLNIFDILQRQIPGLIVTGNPPNQSITFTRNLISITEGYVAPLILWNGMPTDIEMINFLIGSEISYIDVLKGASAAIYGTRGLGGVIAIYAQTGSRYFKPEKGDIGISNFIHPGYYRAREFYCPNYDTIEEKHAKPDFRSTLYWNPDLKTDENGESRFSFYTSDERGKYCMQIEGISSNGKPVSSKYYFTVD